MIGSLLRSLANRATFNLYDADYIIGVLDLLPTQAMNWRTLKAKCRVGLITHVGLRPDRSGYMEVIYLSIMRGAFHNFLGMEMHSMH